MLRTSSAAYWMNPGQLSFPAPVQALEHDCLRCCYISMIFMLLFTTMFRYQLCMFCFRRIMDEFSKACPGCRQVYDESQATHRKRPSRPQQDTHAPQDVNFSSSSRPSTAIAVASAAAGVPASVQQAISRAQTALPPKPPPPAPPKRVSEPPAAPRPPPEPPQALPTGATWGSGPIGRQGSAEPSQSLQGSDEEAWPSLADTSAPAAPAAPASAPAAAPKLTPQQLKRQAAQQLRQQKAADRAAAKAERLMQQQQQQQQEQLQQLQQQATASTSASPSATDILRSRLALASAPQHQQQQRRRPLPPYSPTQEQVQCFAAGEVLAVIGSTSRTFVVPLLSHSTVAVIPGAPQLLESLQQAVYEGSLSSILAAQQLVDLLSRLSTGAAQYGMPGTQHERSSQPGAARRLTPPPGFGSTANSSPVPSSSGSFFSSPADPSVPAPSRRLQPIGMPNSGFGQTGGGGSMGGSSNSLGVFSGDAVVSLGGAGMWNEPAGARGIGIVGRTSSSSGKAPPPGFGSVPGRPAFTLQGSSVNGDSTSSNPSSNMQSQQLFSSAEQYYAPFR
jgi:hypothetical protein